MVAKGILIRSAVGFIYPAYRSVLAVMSDDTEDDMMWMKYWVVLVVFSMVELVVDPLVDYFPWYILAKCAFLAWCMAPLANNGANLIFTQVITCNKSLVIIIFQCLLFHQIIFLLFKKHYLKVKQDPVEEKISWMNFMKRNRH